MSEQERPNEGEGAGFVETVYGRLPGCPVCGLIPLTAPLLCEHGVAPAPKAEIEISMSVDIFDPELYARLIGRG